MKKNTRDKLRDLIPIKLQKKIKRSLKPVNKLSGDGSILLHIGCGQEFDPRYINIDINPLPHIHFVSDVRGLKFLKNNYADLLYASHVLEHFSFRETKEVLEEWKRVLKNGGKLRLSVPNFSEICKIYAEEKNIDKINSALLGNQDGEYNYHKSIFDQEYLVKILKELGFVDIKNWDKNAKYYSFNDRAFRLIKGDKHISLNIEATKK